MDTYLKIYVWAKKQIYLLHLPLNKWIELRIKNCTIDIGSKMQKTPQLVFLIK